MFQDGTGLDEGKNADFEKTNENILTASCTPKTISNALISTNKLILYNKLIFFKSAFRLLFENF